MTQNTIAKDYVSNMDKMIRQNCLKYKGLNTSAEEFIPSNPVLQIAIALQKPVIKTNYIIEDENVFFDRLEYEFVQQNVWLFE